MGTINQNISLLNGEKCLFVNVDGLDYVAQSNFDEADLHESIANDVEEYQTDEDIILHVDTENASDFGCKIMWYEYCGFSDGVEISVQSNFWDTRPPKTY